MIVAEYHPEDLLLRVHRIDESEISLRDASDGHFFSFVQSFRAYGLENKREALFVTSTATAARSEVCKGAPSRSPRVFDKAASVVLLNGRHRIQALRDLRKAVDVALVEVHMLVRIVTRNDNCLTAEMGAFKLRNFADNATSIVCRDYLFIAIVETVISLNAAFKKEHGVSFLAVRMVDNFEDII